MSEDWRCAAAALSAWRRTGLALGSCVGGERHGWRAATGGMPGCANCTQWSRAEPSATTERRIRRKSTAPAMGASVPRSSSFARRWACDRIGVRRPAYERPSAMVERLQCRVRETA
jgi:hypothetical protein